MALVIRSIFFVINNVLLKVIIQYQYLHNCFPMNLYYLTIHPQGNFRDGKHLENLSEKYLNIYRDQCRYPRVIRIETFQC